MAKVTPKIGALYLAKLNCQIGRDMLDKLDKRPPPGVSRVEFAVSCLLAAVEDIAAAMEEKPSGETK